jgi:AcrR family transcriptional regulator
MPGAVRKGRTGCRSDTSRARVNRDRALRAAVALADEAGLESLTMRSLAHELGVVPMALYKHLANKDDLIDGMLDLIIGEIDPAIVGADWRSAVRERIPRHDEHCCAIPGPVLPSSHGQP